MDQVPKLKTFEEHWDSTPGLQGAEMLPASLVLVIAASCYAAGQSSALAWYNGMMASAVKPNEKQV
jgi:hypothetical protein